MKDKNSPQLSEFASGREILRAAHKGVPEKEQGAVNVTALKKLIATREAEGLRDFAKKVSPIRDEVGWHITPKQVQLIEETAKGKDSNG